MVARRTGPRRERQGAEVVDVTDFDFVVVAGLQRELSGLHHRGEGFGGQRPLEVLREEGDVGRELAFGAVGTGGCEVGVLGRLDRVHAARGEDANRLVCGGRAGRGGHGECCDGGGKDGFHGGISFQFLPVPSIR